MKWYLSFVKDKRFAGACIVEGETLKEAIKEAWRHQINPGGEVLGIPVTTETNLPMYRLMTKTELEIYGPTVRSGDYK